MDSNLFPAVRPRIDFNVDLVGRYPAFLLPLNQRDREMLSVQRGW